MKGQGVNRAVAAAVLAQLSPFNVVRWGSRAMLERGLAPLATFLTDLVPDVPVVGAARPARHRRRRRKARARHQRHGQPRMRGGLRAKAKSRR